MSVFERVFYHQMCSYFTAMLKVVFFVIVTCLYVSAETTQGPEIQADEEDNHINDVYPVDVCPTRVPTRDQRLNRRKLKDAIPQLVIQLQETLPYVEKEMNNLKKKKIVLKAKKYKKFGLKELNPKSSRKQNKKLGIPMNKKVRPLFESAWWLTSMLKAAHELRYMDNLSPESKLVSQLDHVSRYVLDTIQEVKVKVSKSSVCYRRHTVQFPLDKTEIDYGQQTDYAALTIRDMYCGLTQLIETLKTCRISVKKSKGKRKGKVARVKCGKLKSVFYTKKWKMNKLCQRRRKLVEWNNYKV